MSFRALRLCLRHASRAICTLALLLAPATVFAQRRLILDFDADWKFHLGDVKRGEDVALNDSSWRTLDLPHDWSIEGEFSARNPAGAGGGALPGGLGWYRKAFAVAERDSNRLVGKEIEMFLGSIRYNGADNDAVLVRPVTPPEKADDDMDDEIPF